MRLIDADAFIEWIDENVSEYTPSALVTKAVVISALKSKNVAPTVGEWVSMKDRLPERGEKVLVISGKYIEVFAFDVICGENAWEDVDGARWSYAEETDYWMPLPEPPEEVIGDDKAGNT